MHKVVLSPAKLIGTRLSRSRFGRHVAILAGGTVIARAITAASAPLLSRLYEPADFGALSIFTSIVTFLLLTCALNYEAAIPLPKEDDTAYNLLILAFGLMLSTSALCGLILWCCGPSVLRAAGVEALQPFVWFIPLSMVGGGTFTILNWWALRVQSFGSLAKRRIAQSVLQVIFQVITPVFRSGPLGLLLGDAVGRAGGSMALALEVKQHVGKTGLSIKPQIMFRAAARYRRFPLVGMGTALIHNAFVILPPLLLTRFFGLREAGWYSLVQQAIGMSLGIIGLSIAQVYTSSAARLARSSTEQLRSLFLKTSRSALLIGVIPLGIAALFGPKLFTFVFGANWMEAGLFCRILALPLLVMFCVGPVFPTLTVLERQHWQMTADSVGVIIMVAGLWYAERAGWSVRAAVGIYGASVIVTYVSLYLLALIAIKRHRVERAEPAESAERAAAGAQGPPEP